MRAAPYSLIALFLLAGCSPATPLFIAQVATQEVEDYKAMKNNRMTAAIEEEGDLLTFSTLAIRDAKSEHAEQTYLTAYHDKKLSDEVRAIALYQIALIYMSRYNEQRNDAKASSYFYKMRNEFPQTRATQRVPARLVMLKERANARVQKGPQELIARWKPAAALDLNKPSLDQDMSLLARRAVLTDRVNEAEELYLLAIEDPGIPQVLKEKALYQLGLMYLAADNPRRDREKGINYLRRLLALFPNGALSGKASLQLGKGLQGNF